MSLDVVVMTNITNEDFINFFERYLKKNKYIEKITEISRSKTGDKDPLIENDFKMISLDDICFDLFPEDNLPRTTDAIWYKEENGKLTLYLIEFKFHDILTSVSKSTVITLCKQVNDMNNRYRITSNGERKKMFNQKFFNDFEKVKNHFGDTAEFSLKMKPIETLSYVLPELYKDYKGHNDERDANNCRDFLNSIEKKYYLFLIRGSSNARYLDKRHNDSRDRNYAKGSGLHKQLVRFKHANIIDGYEIKSKKEFDAFLREEHLKT